MNFNKNRWVSVILISGLLGILIVPQVAFASWWNPFTWGSAIWEMISSEPSEAKDQKSVQKENVENLPPMPPVVIKPNSRAVVVPPVTQSKQQVTNPPVATVETWQELEAKDFVSADVKGWTTQIITNASGEKRYYRKEGTQWVRVNSEADFSTTLCNGVYWNACSTGQNFVCPATGKAYCQPPQQQTPPAQSGTLCNGTYYSSCSTGSDLVCPSRGGGAYCQPKYQAPSPQVQPPAQDQAKIAQTQALLQEYNNKVAALDQQILDIKQQYYVDSAAVAHQGIPIEFIQGQQQKLLTDDNAKIDQLNLQKEQLRLYYLSKINNL